MFVAAVSRTPLTPITKVAAMEDTTEEIPLQGSGEADVLGALGRKLEGDLSFSGERILGSMCTLPHPTSAKVYEHYLDRNIGDPGLHPRLQQLERETIGMLGRLLGSRSAEGAIVTGGTEANLIALWAAKRKHREKRKVVLPESAHFSFDKAADIMDLDLCKIPVEDDGRVDLKRYLEAIDDKTMVLVAVAGTTGLGAVDPITEISDAATAWKLPLHVDAAFGGFVLPFLAEAGYTAPAFDFSLPGVSSITIDPHKMGRCAIPAGAIVFRNHDAAVASETEVSYLAGGKTRQRTIVGTRSGASVASIWATLHRLGRKGYVKTVATCMENSCYLYDRLRSMSGVDAVIEPQMNVVGFSPTKHRRIDPDELARRLRGRGWALSLFPGFLRITVMPHVSRKMLDAFLHDLEEIIA
jgi:tyrosine decarboxylase/aspartate 1-decarboxylase